MTSPPCRTCNGTRHLGARVPGGTVAVPCPACVPFPGGPTHYERWRELNPGCTYAEWCEQYERRAR